MELVFASPWWFYGILILAGALLCVAGLRRGDKVWRNAGLVVLLSGVTILLVSKITETDTEKVTRQSREVVDAVEKQDWAKLSALLDADAIVTLVNVGPLYESREQILEACRSRVAQSGVTGLAVTRADAQVQGDQISVEIDVYVTANEAGGRPLPTTWRLIWAKRGGKWLVRDIEAIKFPVPDVRSWFPTLRQS